MDLDAIINEVADQADEVLARIVARKDAPAVLKEHLEATHGELDKETLSLAVVKVMTILDGEGFFAVSPNETETVWGDRDEPDAATLR